MTSISRLTVLINTYSIYKKYKRIVVGGVPKHPLPTLEWHVPHAGLVIFSISMICKQLRNKYIYIESSSQTNS